MSHVFGDRSWLWFLLQAYYLLHESPNNLKMSDVIHRRLQRPDVPRQVSISPNFIRLFRTKIFHKAFLNLHFRFDIFLAKEYWRKCAQKMLVKLTTGHQSGSKNSFQPKKCLFMTSRKSKKHIFCLGIGMNGGNCGLLILLYRNRPNGKSPDNIHWRMTSQQRDLMWHFFASSKLKHVTCDIWEEKRCT